MRLLLLPGAHCTSRIWDRLRPYLKDYEIDAPDYPHDVTSMAERPEAIAEWVFITTIFPAKSTERMLRIKTESPESCRVSAGAALFCV